MKPYDDEHCECFEIEESINKKYPEGDWNLDECCEEWRERSSELENNNIEYEDGADECYGCCCPTCGRMICGWCV